MAKPPNMDVLPEMPTQPAFSNSMMYDNEPSNWDRPPEGGDDKPDVDRPNFVTAGGTRITPVDYPLPPDPNAPHGVDGETLQNYGVKSGDVGFNGGINNYGLVSGEAGQAAMDDSIAGQGFKK